MNKLVFAALVATASAQLDLQITETGDFESLTPKDGLEIVKGILEGAVDAEGLDNIEECLVDTETIVQDAEEAVADFEKKNAAGIAAGLEKLGDAVMEMKDEIKDCEGVKADLEKLEKMAAIFKSPLTFAYHVGKDLLVNGVQIYHQIDDSVTEWHNGEYNKFGKDVGDAMALLILGAQEEPVEALF
eukprot:CAMPEP_0168612918 /NCGR_PEP_ID=MMETSP0449_2-20121227/3173_1 /TAXON_ID=1082188 /ORGANISM="Strombidium rassoulzadegani, Strain ras09" /LENGTH=186 /DNA_ID=CAMNT_0008653515 /DNA_START=3 /DNA_END=563 /DNA_ORIENTATION=-